VTLRQWVHAPNSPSAIADRLAFEQGMVEAGADAAAHGMTVTCNADTDRGIWDIAFQFWMSLTRQA
jgi:precorrin isomerase